MIRRTSKYVNKYQKFKALTKKSAVLGFQIREMYIAKEALEKAQKEYKCLYPESTDSEVGVADGKEGIYQKRTRKLKGEYADFCEKVENLKFAIETERKSAVMKNIVDDVVLETALEISDLQNKKDVLGKDSKEAERYLFEKEKEIGEIHAKQKKLYERVSEVAMYKTQMGKKSPQHKEIMNKLPRIGNLTKKRRGK